MPLFRFPCLLCEGTVPRAACPVIVGTLRVDSKFFFLYENDDCIESFWYLFSMNSTRLRPSKSIRLRFYFNVKLFFVMVASPRASIKFSRATSSHRMVDVETS